MNIVPVYHNEDATRISFIDDKDYVDSYWVCKIGKGRET